MVIQTAGVFFGEDHLHFEDQWLCATAIWHLMGKPLVLEFLCGAHLRAFLWDLGSNFWRHPLGMSQNNYFEHVAPYHLIPVWVQYIFPASALQSSWKTLLFHQDVRGCSFSNEPWRNIDIAELFLHCILIHPTSQSALTDQEPLEILINENTPGKVSLLEIPAKYMFL